MEPLSDLSHFSTLISQLRTVSKNISTNCYLLPPEINQYIQQRKIFVENIRNEILFLREERDFFYLYYYLLDQQEQKIDLATFPLNKPVIIDTVFVESKMSQTLLDVEKRWINSGFRLYKTYKHMILSIPLGEERVPGIDKKPGIATNQIKYAQPANAADILSLWQSALDIFSTALPVESELVELIEKKLVLCVIEDNGKIAAAFQFQREGKSCMIKHVTVNEAYRQRGLATGLLHACFNENADISRYHLWVDEANLPAVKFYLNNGFHFDGKISRQLVMMKS